MSDSRPTILVVGASGFVGSAVARRLARDEGCQVRTFVRKKKDFPAGVPPVFGDLADTASLLEACSHVDVVIHAASYIGPDAVLAEYTNHRGTKALLEAAARSRVRSFIYPSTTSVYGSGPHRGIAENGAPIAPESPVSLSKAKAEELVLDWGGTVLRTSLVYGRGDRWFIPGLVKLVRQLGGVVNGGGARSSVIEIDLLGRVIARIALDPGFDGQLLHVANPQAQKVSTILAVLDDALRLGLPQRSIPYGEARARIGSAGFHRLALVSEDHYYDVSSLWSQLSIRAESDFFLSPPAQEWYQKILL